ncbi:MAG: hypothetical protein M1816_001872 [Peltula sp. TS41687]|nr:MAG: hypothetical protein M1816_001872 [Peltula sp. TS41687]
MSITIMYHADNDDLDESIDSVLRGLGVPVDTASLLLPENPEMCSLTVKRNPTKDASKETNIVHDADHTTNDVLVSRHAWDDRKVVGEIAVTHFMELVAFADYLAPDLDGTVEEVRPGFYREVDGKGEAEKVGP